MLSDIDVDSDGTATTSPEPICYYNSNKSSKKMEARLKPKSSFLSTLIKNINYDLDSDIRNDGDGAKSEFDLSLTQLYQDIEPYAFDYSTPDAAKHGRKKRKLGSSRPYEKFIAAAMGTSKTKRFQLDTSNGSWVEQDLYCNETLDDKLTTYCVDKATSTSIVSMGHPMRSDFERSCRRVTSSFKPKEHKRVCARHLDYV